MTESKLTNLYILTLEVEQEMLRYANSKISEGKPWFKKSDLNGLCKKASQHLSKKLSQSGIQSQIVLGEFDIPKAGGNGKNLRLPHYWVEVLIDKKIIIADPSCRQFAKHIPATKIYEGKFKIPYVGELKALQSRAYIY